MHRQVVEQGMWGSRRSAATKLGQQHCTALLDPPVSQRLASHRDTAALLGQHCYARPGRLASNSQQSFIELLVRKPATGVGLPHSIHPAFQLLCCKPYCARLAFRTSGSDTLHVYIPLCITMLLHNTFSHKFKSILECGFSLV